jgi:dienelactone hydrolase
VPSPRAAVLLLLAGCTTVPAPRHPRPALPLPDAVAARYALEGPVRELRLVPIGGAGGLSWFRAAAGSGAELAEFTLVRPAAARPPFVLLLPILAGGEDLMWILADNLAARGYAVAWTRRQGTVLRPPQRSAELEQLFQRTVRHNRIVLEWARQQPWLDPERVGCIGISLGGIVATVLAAVEPGIRGAVVCLAGGDLPSLLAESEENRVAAWREWRLRADGIGAGELMREVARELASDPARLAPYLATERVLLINARFDRVVPRRNQELLWEALGRPRQVQVPLGHYSAAVALGHVLGRADEFLGERLAPAQAGGLAMAARRGPP